jgi:hypothetical protein
MTSELSISAPPTARRRLPNRREHELLDFEYAGHCYTAGVGRFPGGGLAEIFMNISGKAGGMVEVMARDSAVLASLALQHGVDLEALRRAVLRDPHGQASGPIGRLLDLISDAPSPAADKS